MSFEIAFVGGHLSLQSEPDLSKLRFGVPPAGAFDQERFRLANALLGNPAGAAVLELGQGMLHLRVRHESRISVISSPGESRAFDVDSGEEIEVRVPKGMARVYVGALGGFRKSGEQELDSARRTSDRGEAKLAGTLDHTPVLRAIRGPQASVVPLGELLDREHSVSPVSDRVGVRLCSGRRLDLHELISEPACVGAVQWTPSGELIIIGPDGPTLGGYAKPLVVCATDMSRVGQLVPGVQVRFELVSVEVARDLWKDYKAELERRCRELELSASLPA